MGVIHVIVEPTRIRQSGRASDYLYLDVIVHVMTHVSTTLAS